MPRLVPGATSSEYTSDFLAAMPADITAQLMERGTEVHLPAGSVFYRPGDQPRVDVVLRGLIRAYFVHPSGRETTVNFVAEGDVAGLTTMFGDQPNLFAEAVIPTSIIALDPGLLASLAEEDTTVARTVARHLARALRRVAYLVSLRTLGSIRQRLAFDLLERARRTSDGQVTVFAVTHAELAASLGSSREVVSREIAALRRQGLIRTWPGGLEIVSVERLAAVVAGFWPSAPATGPGA
ncbi:MAG TPA: Crp/Fnr family transcriptional regulator [Candidatus Dormibacteraeota bacterium]